MEPQFLSVFQIFSFENSMTYRDAGEKELKKRHRRERITIHGPPADLHKGTAGKHNDFLRKLPSIHGWSKILWFRANPIVPGSFFLQWPLGSVKKMVSR
jgi:hypothetical protein